MDDRVRKIISFRRQEEAGWQPLPAGPERKTRPALADWAAAMGKQRKILFVQAVFYDRTPIGPGWGLASRRLCTVKGKKVTSGCRKCAARRCRRHAPAMRDPRLSLVRDEFRPRDGHGSTQVCADVKKALAPMLETTMAGMVHCALRCF
jgi:hypothetical protein